MDKITVKQSKVYRTLYSYSQKYIPYTWLSIFGIHNIDHEHFFHFSLIYGFSFLVSLNNIFLSILFLPYADVIPLFMIYVVTVGLCTWVGGLKAGILTAAMTATGSFLLLMSLGNEFHTINFSLLLQFVVFIISALIISVFINQTAHIDDVVRLKKQERVYARMYHNLFNAYRDSRSEIKARDEFLSIVSHELKIPLTTMLLNLHNMLNNVRNVSLANFSIPELMKVLINAENEIKSLSIRINDLVDLSLITTGRMNLERKKIDLVAIAEQVRDNFSEMLKHDGYDLKIESTGAVIGYWDKSRIEQVMTNLLSNAMKYGQNKPIIIQISNSNTVGKFIIQDHGIGISKEDQKIIFDRFKRGKESEEYTKGYGVGLYITHMIVKDHGGTIKISSTPGRGTTFTVQLPRNENKSQTS